jgi:hypothetical protein
MPWTSATMAVMISAALGTSTGPGAGLRDSGTSTGARTSSGSSTGTARRNTDPHQKCWSRNPPTTGPRIPPAEKPVAHTAMAVRRCVASWKMLRSRDRVAGISIDPKRPSSARAATSASPVGANAASADTAAKPVLPTSSSRRRPTRSPREPMGTSSPASTSG